MALSEMRFHHGMRLKNKIEKSNLTVSAVANKLGIQRGSLYHLFTKAELLRSEIQPVLDIISVPFDEFLLIEESQASYGFKAENEALKREIELLKEQVKQLKEMNALLKARKK